MATKTLKGTRLGDYQVRDLLGSGGMASVYKGYDSALDREVAIKVIHTEDESPDFIARFRREAKVVASLRHANIVQVYQFGEQDGIIYMVQELLPGPTLEEQMKKSRRRMSATRVTTIINQLASALDYAHAQGVIHRDIKPSNALYNSNSELVLTDFGIARSHHDAKRTATNVGMVMGTPGYIAPEQAVSSATITNACDIYALGIVAFELLTGRMPFEAENAMEAVAQHLYNDPPRPGSIRSDLSAAVDRVLLKALSKEPGDRYASAGAFAQSLQNALNGGSGSARAKSSSSSSSSSSRSAKSSQSNKSSSSSSSSSSRSRSKDSKDKSSKSNGASSSRSRTPAKAADKSDSARKGKESSARRGGQSQSDQTPQPGKASPLRLLLLLLVLLIGAGGAVYFFTPYGPAMQTFISQLL
jgi:eukaryotic-like serine/threonine-protein kinase